MKRLLIVTAAISALATAAAAQPAYNGSQGPPPQDYPVCTHRGQDRCIQPRAARRIDRELHHVEK